MKIQFLFCFLSIGIFGFSCGGEQTPPASAPSSQTEIKARPDGYYDDIQSSGVKFVHTDGSSGRHYIVETVTAGLGLFDYDNDGDLDIYFVNGAALPGQTFESPPRNALYRNDGGNKFADATDQAGVGDEHYGMGCVMGDIDNDGWMDIYVSNYGPDVLYHNNGDGTFTNITAKAKLGDPRLGAGACMADYNADGWLDIFAANYLQFPIDVPSPCSRLGVPLYCDPSTFDMYEPEQASLYLNNHDGTFTDYTEASGIAAFRGRGMGAACTDYDNDGDTDIYIANDVDLNFLYANKGNGIFDEVGLFAGIAYDQHGQEQGSMGCDFGDYNGDGWYDLIVTSYQRQQNTLYRNRGDGTFEDVTIPAGLLPGSMEYVSWATFFFDYDNDADKDIFIANGHLQDNIEKLEEHTKYLEPNQLFRNNGDGTFTDISKEAGPGFQVLQSTRGGAFGDLDNDGDLDIVLSNSRAEATLLINELHNSNHWINIKLQGTKSNRNGVGAQVFVTAGGKTQKNEVRAGSSYQSHYDLRLHFGLGKAKKIDEIKVQWVGRGEDIYRGISADRFILLKEGASDIDDQKI
ncbi:MAG: CRTAC1 family protein [Candidatus Omnitrophota bacterium]